jgi:ribonuclease T1
LDQFYLKVVDNMKPSSWKQLILYLVIFAGLYLIFNLASGNSSLLNCTPASPDLKQGSQTSSTNQDNTNSNTNVISVAALPTEGRATLQLIKSGGPFPYSKDGTVFSNYEGLLPKQSNGYYHEYTVITPGSSDRGARRIIAGKNSEYYYTNDHYASFKLIQE